MHNRKTCLPLSSILNTISILRIREINRDIGINNFKWKQYKIMKIFIISFILGIFYYETYAEIENIEKKKPETTSNDISDAKFVIKKDKAITFYDIGRIYFIPPTIAAGKHPKVFYSNKILAPNFGQLHPKLRLLKAKKLPLITSYNNYTGFGGALFNKGKPAAYLNIILGKKNDLYSINICGNMLFSSYIKRAYFKESSRIYMDNSQFGPDMTYNRQVYKRNDDIESKFKNTISEEQALNTLTTIITLEGDYNINTKYDLPLSYELFKTNSDLKEKIGQITEHTFAFKPNFNLHIPNIPLDLKIIADLSLMQKYIFFIGDGKNKKRYLDKFCDIKCAVCYKYKDFLIEGGVRLFGHNNNNKNNSKKFLFSPLILLQYKLNDLFRPYLKASLGSIKKNSYANMMKQNPLWIIREKGGAIQNIYKKYDISLGATSMFPYNVVLLGSINFEEVFNFPSFKRGEDKKFEIMYTKNLKILNPHLETNIKNDANTIFFNINLDYFLFLNNAKVDYEPKYKINIITSYKLQDKLSIRSNIYYCSGAAFSDGGVEKSIDPTIDIGLGMSYTIVDNLIFTIDFENLLTRINERYNHIPGRNFMVLFCLGYRW